MAAITRKFLLIFGAGASYGSDTRDTPPIGADLFDALVQFDPDGWGSINSKVSKVFSKDIEAGMRLLLDSDPIILPRLQKAMAAFFFAFRPKPTNLYCRLAHLIKSNCWEGAVITLNYELLLQAAFVWSDITLLGSDTGALSDGIELCLPHGSCNVFFGPTCSGASPVFSSRTLAPPSEFDSPIVQVMSSHYEYACDYERFKECLRSSRFPPVMSYFEPTKMTHSGANYIETERKRYTELVESSTTIGIVGMKVRIHDTHIWEPLANTNAKIVYCSGRSAAREFDAWREEHRYQKGDVILPFYFAEGFWALCSHIGLKGESSEG